MSCRDESGFSLMELLVSTAIISILLISTIHLSDIAQKSIPKTSTKDLTISCTARADGLGRNCFSESSDNKIKFTVLH